MNETATTASASAPAGNLLVCLPALGADALQGALANLRAAFPGERILISSPEARGLGPDSSFTVVSGEGPAAGTFFIPSAADYVLAGSLARQHEISRILILGSEAQSILPETLAVLAREIGAGNDLAVPRFHFGPHEGLVNSALLYPLSRSLFAEPIHFPLPVDAALSPRMASRLAGAAQNFTASGQADAFLWPVAEAAAAGFLVREVDVAVRAIPHPPGDSINDVLASILASLFTEIEARAPFWQRARLMKRPAVLEASAANSLPLSVDLTTELAPHLENFHLAYTNLRDLWSLVLPPQTLLALKKLSITPLETFHLPADLWARVVYDFVLAWRLRTINRGHLLGAFTPLYFAWVASHLVRVQSDATLASQRNEENALAFEAEKPYLVARWRSPDRFNP